MTNCVKSFKVEFDQIINPNVMALMRTYREMKTVVGRYEREVWEYEQKLKRKQKPAERPPEKKKYRDYEEKSVNMIFYDKNGR